MARHLRQRLSTVLPGPLVEVVTGVLRQGGSATALTGRIGSAFRRLFERTGRPARNALTARPTPFRPPERSSAPAAAQGPAGGVNSLRSFGEFLRRLRRSDPVTVGQARRVKDRVTRAFGNVETEAGQAAPTPTRFLIAEAERMTVKAAAGCLEGTEKIQGVQGMLAVLARAVIIQRHMDRPPISNRVM